MTLLIHPPLPKMSLKMDRDTLGVREVGTFMGLVAPGCEPG